MKRIIVFILIVTSALLSNAQIRIQTPEQSLITTTFNSAYVKASRSYVVRDKESDETYKRDGRNDFNEVQSFGIRIKGGLIVPSTLVRPWEKDTAFVEYRNWYDGVARRFTAEMPNGKVNIDSNLNIVSCHNGNMLYMVSLGNDVDGLAVDTTNGNVDGWIILWMTDNDTATSISSFRKEIVLSSGKEIVEIDKPHTSSNIVGGAFVKPVYPSLGVIEFRLCGVVMDGGEKLQIVRPSIKSLLTPKNDTKAELPKEEQDKRPTLKGLSPVHATPGRPIDGGKKKGKKK